MKKALPLLLSLCASAAHAFAPSSRSGGRRRPFALSSPLHLAEAPAAGGGSYAENAARHFAGMSDALAPGVDPPPEVDALRKALDEGADEETLMTRVYELMCEQAMLFDQDPETGMFVVTEADYVTGRDVPELKEKIGYIYGYGMGLVTEGMLGVEACKGIVQSRLIERTGLAPEEFDKWLGY